jgi:hypothetical protein
MLTEGLHTAVELSAAAIYTSTSTFDYRIGISADSGDRASVSLWYEGYFINDLLYCVGGDLMTAMHSRYLVSVLGIQYNLEWGRWRSS